MQAKVKATKCIAQQEYDDKVAQLDSEIDGLSAAIFVARERIAALQEALRKGEEEMGNLQRAQDTTKYHFNAQIGVGEGEIQVLKEGMDRLHFDSKVKLYGQPLHRPHPIVSRSTLPTANLLVPPLAFTIFDFPDKRKHDAVMFTPPFLTHNRGYTMCLQIHCNGDDRGKGKWLSIYAYILRGEYDDYLLWPFCGSITVEVRNLLRNPRYNHVKTIRFAPRPDSCGVRVQGEEYIAPNCLGYWNFMYLSVLFPSYSLVPSFQYIQNECLKIDVSKVKLD
jgi:TNF receptor-associated factor 4